MNQNLQRILEFIGRNEVLTADEKLAISTSVRDADRDQNRELEIEAALERVRTVAMGMNNPEDMLEVCKTISKQLSLLHVKEIRNVQTGIFYESKKNYTNYEYYAKHDKCLVTVVDYNNHPVAESFASQMLKGPNEVFVYGFKGDEVKDWLQYQKTTNVFIDSYLETANTLNYYWYSLGPVALGISTYVPLPDNEVELFKRFRNVFELAYRRYLDIEKAAAQAREAQIQLSLERVRARTMAMQHSRELAETAAVLFEQFYALGEIPERMAIEIVNEEEHVFDVWATEHGGKQMNQLLKASLDEPHVMKKMYEAWKEHKKSITIDLQGKELAEYFQFLKDEGHPVNREIFGNRRVQNVATFSKGILTIITPEPRPQETIDILERFAAVFDGTYTRFLDLQKAEAQAKEAQIEAGLERVRSRAMAMQSSNELGGLVGTVFSELTKLNLVLTRSVIWIFDEKTDSTTWWMANSEDPEHPMQCHLPYHENEPYLAFLQQWKKRTLKFQYELKDKIKADWDEYLFNKTGLAALPSHVKDGMKSSSRVLLSASFNNFGAMNVASLEPLTEEDFDILLRFAKVFDLTYTRFNDLKQAEAQAREAKIEAALERVRGKAMAMHNSNDLSFTASMVFTELRKLGIAPIRCGVGLLDKESRRGQLYSATSSAEGDSLALVGWVELSGHPVLNNIYDTWLKNEDYFPELSGDQLKSYYDLLLKGLPVKAPNWETGQQQHGTFLPFSVGCLYAWSDTLYNDAEIKILKRFAGIIDLTFRRYIELQQSEANAKDAVKQAALDRIRADIASMRAINDLDRIIPLIWKELTILGIPFMRCGVFIMDDLQQLIHTFLSTPDGKAIAAFHIPYDTPGNITAVLNHWHNKRTYIDHWDEREFIEFAGIIAKQGSIISPDQYLKTVPHEGFYLHFLPFLQGMLYVGNASQLGEEEIQLIQSVAEAFSTAYARYEDFNRLEAAKQQVEKTLVDLRQTQQQLVQSEKMASLGELTAGIAHEIQNPLNFVNNFSEVSNELLDEMTVEMEKGNKEEAAAIAADVRQNLGKILHHGKRADAIVKGMLQHSRTSSGQKEPTDINILADEYLRLAYHGLRAKDKTFNAKFETSFDSSINKLNIIPQDIGRVILNLINNAFYTVTEKKNTHKENYEPTVTVTTKQVNGHIEVRVEDNGDGIPKKILDKIFQPFFTTKPSGQGTGLGLSLAYDIITKGHGGELKVNTHEGQGSEFIIQLPNS